MWKKVFHFVIDSSSLNSKILFDKKYNTKTEVYEFKKNLYLKIFEINAEKFCEKENNNCNSNNKRASNYIPKKFIEICFIL